MNILFVSAVFPYPLHSGGQIRIYNLLKQLGTRHEITLVSFIRDDSERDYANQLRFCKQVHMVMRGRAWQLKYIVSALFGKYPFLLATYDNEEMRALLSRLLSQKSFDLVHLEPFYVWPSLPETTVPIVVSEHNIEYEVYQQYAKRFPLFSIDTAKLRTWEEYVWKKATYVTTVSEKDKSVIQKNVTVVPNGVDTSQFTFQKHTTCKFRVLFVGNFRWIPNRDAAYTLVRDIYPNLRKRFPQTSLRIVGIDIPADIKREVIGMGGQIGENVSDIGVEYRSADVLIAPHAISGGTKYKMLEAFASGLPVITTKQGVSGLEVIPDVHLKQAATPDDFVVKTEEIWENTKETDRMVQKARILVEEKYSWERIAGALEGVWNEAGR